MNPQRRFENRFMDFGAGVLMLTARLPKTPMGRYFADQLLRSGTTVGAHMREARSAESRADLIHKMQIALKEIREANYWLILIERGGLLKDAGLNALVQESGELTAIVAQSVITAKRNSENQASGINAKSS
jgi:four helix bundle protein